MLADPFSQHVTFECSESDLIFRRCRLLHFNGFEIDPHLGKIVIIRLDFCFMTIKEIGQLTISLNRHADRVCSNQGHGYLVDELVFMDKFPIFI